MNEAICDWGQPVYESGRRPIAISLTPRFSGVQEPDRTGNRFSGFKGSGQTVEAVSASDYAAFTLLKQGVNETKGFGLQIACKGVNEKCIFRVLLMKQAFVLFAISLLLPRLACATDYNLGELARTNKVELVNRSLTEPKADSPEAIFLDAAPGDGLAWITGVEFSEGTIELEIKGQDEQGRSFVGIAFHGQDNQTFDAVYLRPFNFQSAEPERQHHSIQYISIPGYDWKKLRDDHPGKYEFAITPPPDPNSWVKLKLVIRGNNVEAFVNGSERPALTVEPLNNRLKGKVALWVGNGSDGGFRNLKVVPASK